MLFSRCSLFALCLWWSCWLPLWATDLYNAADGHHQFMPPLEFGEESVQLAWDAKLLRLNRHSSIRLRGGDGRADYCVKALLWEESGERWTREVKVPWNGQRQKMAKVPFVRLLGHLGVKVLKLEIRAQACPNQEPWSRWKRAWWSQKWNDKVYGHKGETLAAVLHELKVEGDLEDWAMPEPVMPRGWAARYYPIGNENRLKDDPKRLSSGYSFTAPESTGVDEVLDFQWSSEAWPVSDERDTYFGVVWRGRVQIESEGKHNFYFHLSKGAQLRSSGNLMGERGISHSIHGRKISVQLSPGTYELSLDYLNRGLSASELRLEWETPLGSREVMASSNVEPWPEEGTGLSAVLQHRDHDTQYLLLNPELGMNFKLDSLPTDGHALDGVRGVWRGSVSSPFDQEVHFSGEGLTELRVGGVNFLAKKSWGTAAPKLQMAAHERFPIVLRYDASLSEQMSLLWSSNVMAEQVVPTSALFPNTGVSLSIYDDLQRRELVSQVRATGLFLRYSEMFGLKDYMPDPRLEGPQFTADYEGYVVAPESGVYTFKALSSNDYSLSIDGRPAMARMEQPGYVLEQSFDMELEAGRLVPLRIQWQQKVPERQLNTMALLWSGPGLDSEVPLAAPHLLPRYQNTRWLATTAAAWSDPQNWSAGQPDADTMLVLDSRTRADVVLDGDVEIGTLVISSDFEHRLILKDYQLTIHGDLIIHRPEAVEASEARLVFSAGSRHRWDAADTQWGKVNLKTEASLEISEGCSMVSWTLEKASTVMVAPNSTLYVDELDAQGDAESEAWVQLVSEVPGQAWQLWLQRGDLNDVRLGDLHAPEHLAIYPEGDSQDQGGNQNVHFVGEHLPAVTITGQRAFLNSTKVSLEASALAAGMEIFYTFEPTGDPAQVGQAYTGPITLTESASLRAVVARPRGRRGWRSGPVSGASFHKVDLQDVYARKTYGGGAVLKVADVRRFEGQVWWVGPDGLPDEMAGDDLRVPELDEQIQWSCTGGTIEKIEGTEHGGAAVFRAIGTHPEANPKSSIFDAYSITLKIGANSFTGCNNSKVADAPGEPECRDGSCQQEYECEADCEGTSDCTPVWVDATGCSPIPMKTVGKEVDLHVTVSSSVYHVTPFSFGHAARCSHLHELLEVDSDNIVITWVWEKSVAKLIYQKGGDGVYHHVSGGRSRVEKISEGHFVYKASDGSFYEFNTSIGMNLYRATSYGDQDKNTITFDYESERKLVITDASKNIYEIYADKTIDGVPVIDKIVTISYAGGRKSWSYEYDDRGFLTRERFDDLYEVISDGSSDYGLMFDRHGNLVKFIDRNQHFKALEYDDLWRLDKREKSDGSVWHSEKSARNGLYWQMVTDPNGSVTKKAISQGKYQLLVSKEYADGLIENYDYVPGTPYISKETKIISDDSSENIITLFEYDDNYYRTAKIVDPEGLNLITRWTYDDRGNKTSATDPNGVVRKMEYDANNRLIADIRDFGGANLITQFSYDEQGNKVSEIDPLGHEQRWTYDEFGRIISYIDALGHCTLRSYDVWGNRVAETDRNGNTTRYEYDLLNRKIREIDPLGYAKSFGYDGNDNVVRVEDEIGAVTVYEFNALNQNTVVKGDASAPGGCGSCGGSEANAKEGEYVYNHRGDLLSFTDIEGLKTIYTYDSIYRKTKQVVDPEGLALTSRWNYDRLGRLITERHFNADGEDRLTHFVYDKAGRKVEVQRILGEQVLSTRYEYDNMSHVVAMIDPAGQRSTRSYDNLYRLIETVDVAGKVTRRIYDDAGRLIETVEGVGVFDYITRHSYDAVGRVIQIVEPDGGVQIFTHDANGNRLSFTDANGNTRSYEYDDKNFMVASTDAAGFTTRFDYDGLGNRTTITDALGTVTRNTYDEKSFLVQSVADVGGIAQTRRYGRNGVMRQLFSEDAFGTVTQIDYDSAHRRVGKVVDPDGAAVAQELILDDLGQVIESIDAAGFVTKITYDALGRRTQLLKADGGRESFVYDLLGRVIEHRQLVEGEREMITRNAYDAMGRVTSSIEDADGLALETKREYDVLGRLLRITDAKGSSTSYAYDSENRLIRETYADGGIIEMAYDLGGRLIRRIDQQGEIVNYSYDERNLLVKKTYANGGEQTFVYDALGRMTQSTDNNEDTLLVTSSSSYDSLGRQLTSTQKLGQQPAQTLKKVFDAHGHEVECHHPNGRVVSFTYTPMHQVDAIYSTSGNSTTQVTDYTYAYEDDDTDRRPVLVSQTMNTSTPITLQQSFDVMGRTLSRVYKKEDQLLVGFDHEYNLRGDRLQDRHLHNSAHSETYNYDSAQRFDGLEREDGFQQSWQLDKLGNWMQFDNNGQIEDRSHNSVNEITSITPDKTLTYDDKGNMTFHKDKNYVYDANNRLAHVYNTTSPGQVARYYYSAMNQRVMKHVDTDDDGLLDDKTVYIYCHQKVCEEQDENGNFKRDYIHGGQFIDEVVMTSDSPEGLGSFTLTDLRYSVYAVVDASGEIVERYQYTPYGERTVMTASFVEASESAIGQEFGYTGRRHDAEDTGLMYFRARYYSGELGRFVSRDPLGTALDVNYQYNQRRFIKYTAQVSQLAMLGVSLPVEVLSGVNYSDGMNLYRGYFTVNGVDPEGKFWSPPPGGQVPLTPTPPGTVPPSAPQLPPNTSIGFGMFAGVGASVTFSTVEINDCYCQNIIILAPGIGFGGFGYGSGYGIPIPGTAGSGSSNQSTTTTAMLGGPISGGGAITGSPTSGATVTPMVGVGSGYSTTWDFSYPIGGPFLCSSDPCCQ